MRCRQSLNRKRVFLEIMALLFVVSGILYEGLRPFVLFLPNSARWLDEGPGIELRGRAFALTAPWIPPSLFDPASGISLEVWLRADARKTNGIVNALTLHDGTFPALLSVGQARSTLHVRGRSSGLADVTSSWGIRKGGGFSSEIAQMVVVTSIQEDGTLLYLNGKRAGHSEAGSVQGITPGHEAQIILGTAADGKGQWSGEIYRIALYNRVLSAAEISMLWSEIHTRGERTVKDTQDLIALYSMDHENEKGQSHSPLERTSELKVPPTVIPAERSDFLSLAPSIDVIDVKDIWRNLLGFMPLGFLLLLVLRRMSNADIRRLSLLAIAAGIVSSLFIEMAQAYSPSRHSSLLDLGLNSMGALLGTRAACLFLRHAKRTVS